MTDEEKKAEKKAWDAFINHPVYKAYDSLRDCIFDLPEWKKWKQLHSRRQQEEETNNA